jgi:MtN3 and saliva related transmembrane protein
MKEIEACRPWPGDVLAPAVCILFTHRLGRKSCFRPLSGTAAAPSEGFHGEFVTVDSQAVIGFLAGALTTAANAPQVWKTYKNRSAEGLSFWMLIALAAGLALWIAYGISSKSAPIVAANIAGFLLVLALISMKFRFDRNPAKD